MPALETIFGNAVDASSPEQAAKTVSKVLGVKSTWISADTGFSNFYNAYRNSSLPWVKQHRAKIERLVRDARTLNIDVQARALVEIIERMPGVPKPNPEDPSIHAEQLLTPLLFALDPRLRFPVINGRKPIKDLLRMRGVSKASLAIRFDTMVELIGTNGWKDAAELDSSLNEDADIAVLATSGQAATLVKVSQPLTPKPTDGKDLKVKDEADQTAISAERTDTKRRLHNKMTNRLLELFGTNYLCKEGCTQDALYDAMVVAYGEDEDGYPDDLLIEVKSCSEEAHVRMAIGQLYAYGHRLRPKGEFTSAVLLPDEPGEQVKSLLKSRGFGCLWYIDNKLSAIKTNTPWLKDWVASQNT
ncbi:hypothetical protein [Dyella nitratireducens]|uniref:Uncharacterized protein n=1 Tax=Dyella nitratireducens TaxID=1849580 RepID=A0ABQ1FUE1_9GAMM|nr:hypothetical protein [Dyella nitratireducens]GGA29061.1 hypothetical protein GCM10010981_17390 [Dyella nitratireducens]GLQ43196.1 hypothetical protein GCM10007902_30460 [Dyella nitratireducens]